MRQKTNRSEIFSATAKERWRPSASSIRTLSVDHAEPPAVSILRTLLDQPRWLEPRYLYDDVGTQLFERICELPEYYLTRTENELLARHATEIIARAPVRCLVELGAGSAKKTLHLLTEQMRQRGSGIFVPIDVSLAGLRACRDALAKHLPTLDFQGLQGPYEDGLSAIEKKLPKLVIFLGSSVGNFNRSEFVRFFRHLAASLGPKDFFLLGADRVKESEILEKAYDDSQGVTAEFILNVFRNINRLVKSDFDLQKMRYRSWYNQEWQQVEMYAVATATQEIHFGRRSGSFTWKKGERILVEISRKFEPEALQAQLRLFGLRPLAHFTDAKEWFSLLLFQKAGGSIQP